MPGVQPDLRAIFFRGDGLTARRISLSGACGVLGGACSGLFPRPPGP